MIAVRTTRFLKSKTLLEHTLSAALFLTRSLRVLLAKARGRSTSSTSPTPISHSPGSYLAGRDRLIFRLMEGDIVDGEYRMMMRLVPKESPVVRIFTSLGDSFYPGVTFTPGSDIIRLHIPPGIFESHEYPLVVVIPL